MKKNGILNSDLSKLLSDLRHTDEIIIGDAGLPVPIGVKQIDLSLKLGTPSFVEVLDLVNEEMIVESCMIASEMLDKNPRTFEMLNELYQDDTIKKVSHQQFKELSRNVKAIIRTGENTPYANIILKAGCLF